MQKTQRSRVILNIVQTIRIKKEANAVFAYYGDLRNDCEWRAEINSTRISSQPFQLHSIALEDAFLSKRVPHHITPLTCTSYVPNHTIVYETVTAHHFFLRTSRTVISLNPHESEVIYQIEFDKDIAAHGIGFSLPTFLIKFITNMAMIKYLKQLKGNLEIVDQNI